MYNAGSDIRTHYKHKEIQQSLPEYTLMLLSSYGVKVAV
jgi:hypothetical protein